MIVLVGVNAPFFLRILWIISKSPWYKRLYCSTKYIGEKLKLALVKKKFYVRIQSDIFELAELLRKYSIISIESILLVESEIG